MYDFAVMMKQQMEDIGFVVDLQVVDWATLSTRRFNRRSTTCSRPASASGSVRPVFQAILSCVGRLDL